GESKQACTLLSEPTGTLPLPGAACPAWVFPNADAAGYFRFALPPAELAKLRASGLAKLSVREKMAFTNTLRAAYGRGTTLFKDVVPTVARLTRETHPSLAGEAGNYIASARDWFEDDAALL